MNGGVEMDRVPPCAGVVVFRVQGDGTYQCILVQSHRGGWGFPKGSRVHGESVLANALRELCEETGLGEEQIRLVPASPVDELSKYGDVRVRYFAAELVDSKAELVLEKEEHRALDWFTIARALDLLQEPRRRVLTRLLSSLASTPTASRSKGV